MMKAPSQYARYSRGEGQATRKGGNLRSNWSVNSQACVMTGQRMTRTWTVTRNDWEACPHVPVACGLSVDKPEVLFSSQRFASLLCGCCVGYHGHKQNRASEPSQPPQSSNNEA